MSDRDSPVAATAEDVPDDGPIDDGQEKEFEDEVAAADSDRDSDALSEIDENEFEDYDPETANIASGPVDIDEDAARTLKVSKRKKAEGPKKPKEGRREKKRRDRDDDVTMDDGGDDDGEKTQRRRRGGGDGGERAPRAKEPTPEPENEDNLSPEEKRKRAIDRALDAAIKKGGSSTKRRKKDEIVSCNTANEIWTDTDRSLRIWKMKSTNFWYS